MKTKDYLIAVGAFLAAYLVARAALAKPAPVTLDQQYQEGWGYGD